MPGHNWRLFGRFVINLNHAPKIQLSGIMTLSVRPPEKAGSRNARVPSHRIFSRLPVRVRKHERVADNKAVPPFMASNQFCSQSRRTAEKSHRNRRTETTDAGQSFVFHPSHFYFIKCKAGPTSRIESFSTLHTHCLSTIRPPRTLTSRKKYHCRSLASS